MLLTSCQVHGDTEATLQCVLCLRAKVDLRKSYHCSTDCFRKHWHLHRDLHGQPSQRNGAVSGSNSLPQPSRSPFDFASQIKHLPAQQSENETNARPCSVCMLALTATHVDRTVSCPSRTPWHPNPLPLIRTPTSTAGFGGSEGSFAPPDNGFKGAQSTYSNGGETWMEVRPCPACF